MRIVIDMQGVQSPANGNRGIGRYTMSLALAMIKNRGEHEIFLALNGAFPDSIARIRLAFDGLLPLDQIRVWRAPDPMAYVEPANTWRRKSGELVREAFLASLHPDFVLVSSLFEGLGDSAVTSVKRFAEQPLTAVILYDLIPLIHRQPYLENPVVSSWYMEKIEHLRQADLWLGISASSCQEGVDQLQFPTSRCLNISTDADAQFQKTAISADAEQKLLEKYCLLRPFVMYTGGIDHRKNIEGLIRAYAKLPTQLRHDHQLAIVCSVQEDSRQRLLGLAQDVGLGQDEVILTGFVSEEDLIALYNLCAMFVFPSWHEGFGLPALEAMRCGAPVIAAGATSLIEVVGFEDALFDPHSDDAITHAIERVLMDQKFRAQLIANGKAQSNKFSWNETARRAIDAMTSLVAEKKGLQNVQAVPQKKRRLAYVSPLPPERSGIADYSAELLPALAQHYEIEVVVAQDWVEATWIEANCPIRTVQWFKDNKDHFDRVIYHFGNSAFHQHMFELLRKIPGVVVLHDFYLSGVLHYMDATGFAPDFFQKQLYRSHGYAGLLARSQASDIADIIWQYPCSRTVIEDSIGTIFHSENSNRLVKRWYGSERHNTAVIPHMRAPASPTDASVLRQKLGLPENSFVVCSFGLMGPTKLNHRLLNVWFDSDLSKSNECHLIFVGENHDGEYGHELTTLIEQHVNGGTVHITGWADMDVFRSYLSIADLAVQLRTLSRGETSGTVLDCMNYGLATIVNANGSMADLDAAAVWKLPDEFDDQELKDALEILWHDHERRRAIGVTARHTIFESHDPSRCAAQYEKAIEDFYSKRDFPFNSLLEAIASESDNSIEKDLQALAKEVAITFPPAKSARTLFVDVSELVQRDAKTGIQRVVRNVLQQWLQLRPVGWRVEPVYSDAAGVYFYARNFTANFLGISNISLDDDPIDFSPGDLFFGLDLCPVVQIANAHFYQQLRERGVIVKFMVYDLLCITQQRHFVDGAKDGFSRWLHVVAENDGAVCISNSVATELRDWMSTRRWKRMKPFELDVNHLGVEVNDVQDPADVRISIDPALKILKNGISFLMVGTVEPRKGHAQVLDALEKSWLDGVEINLVIVGKQGWMVDNLAGRLRHHPELGKKLFWLEGVSNEYLEQVYAISTCLIAASYGEGFGLPLIEAAQHKLPIIARDIPVFREVAGEYAFFFDAANSVDLANAIYEWLMLYKLNQHPKSDAMPWLTWEKSSQQLLEILQIRQ